MEESTAPTVVAVTGVSGALGRRLVALLDADPAVERVVGVDLVEPLAGSPKLEFHQMDVRDARLAKVVAGAHALCHLAFRVEPLRHRERMRLANVEGTRSVLDAARAGGVRKLVHVSSATVYGAHPDNEFPLTEASPLRATPDFPYAWQKLEAERMVEAFREERPEVVVTTLRPAVVLGPGVENAVSRMLEAPRLLAVRGYEPPVQVVHEEDLAAALRHALSVDLPGAYNVAADGWLAAEEAAALVGRKRLELPEAVAFAVVGRLARLGLLEIPPGALPYLMHPWVVDAARLRSTGWRPTRSNRETLLEAVEAHRPWLAVGRLRVRRALLARAAAGALAAGAAAAWLRRARRR
jgi:nucleoside-diphosphate-sugar epimerase